METAIAAKPKHKGTSYAKWGYIFIAAFFVVYFIFTFIPQVISIFDSFFDYDSYADVLERDVVAPWCGFQNYVNLFKVADNGDIIIFKTLGNTLLMWVIGAIPQMVFALILALIFTATKLKLKCAGFFKTIFYMPNLIMAAAFAALFLALFGMTGPIHNMFLPEGSTFDFIQNPTSGRLLVAFMNFLMWFGNTTILLMAGIQGIDESVFESARLDGASSTRVLFDITLPLLRPIVVYVLITSMIGGLQMFDVPQVLTGKAVNTGTETMVMYMNKMLINSNYGRAGAVSVILFILTGILSLIVFKFTNKKEN